MEGSTIRFDIRSGGVLHEVGFATVVEVLVPSVGLLDVGFAWALANVQVRPYLCGAPHAVMLNS